MSSSAGIWIPILGIMCGMVAIIANAILRGRKLKIEEMRLNKMSSASESEMQAEIQRLKDRVAVLERLATDGERKLAGDIERLRDRDVRG